MTPGRLRACRTSSWSLSRATTWPGSFSSGIPCRRRKPVRWSGGRPLVWSTCTSTASFTATVKPANLMLTLSGQVKVLDLGVARYPRVPVPGEQITLHGQLLGTPDYMAPEQCLDCHAVAGRADISALGGTRDELLTGQAPFAGPDHGSVYLKMKAHVEAPVPPGRRRRPGVPERLAVALERMLAKDLADRFV